MRLPFVSRYMHEQVVGLLEARIAELNEERRAYIDRLLPEASSAPVVETYADEPEQPMSEEEREHFYLRSLRNRPSTFAAAVSQIKQRRASMEADSKARGLHIARMTPEEMDRQIEAAVERGKARAS